MPGGLEHRTGKQKQMTKQIPSRPVRQHRIPSDFSANGFHFVQLAREGAWALYRKEKPDWVGFEVVRFRRRGSRRVFGKTVAPKEVYPPSEKWGVDGFSLMTEAAARRKMALLRTVSAKNGIPGVYLDGLTPAGRQ